MIYDTVIIGSGPAGYTAALYTSRAFLKTLVLAGPEPGGQLTTTTEVDNFPGFPQGIMGPTLVTDMKKQVERFGAEIKQEAVVSIGQGDIFTIKTADNTYQAKTIIVATGASAMYLGLPSEARLKGKGVSGCATCDGFFFRGKVVTVIGGGDTAMEEATFLTKFSPKVTIIHRRDEFRASAIMLDRAKKDERISFLTNKIVEEILGDTEVTGIRLRDAKTGEMMDYPTQGVFLAIGHKPSTGFLQGVVALDPKGYVLTNSKQLTVDSSQKDEDKEQAKNPALLPQTETSIPGIFAAGDCVDPRYRQAIVAAGQGCMAAMDAEKYLETHGS